MSTSTEVNKNHTISPLSFTEITYIAHLLTFFCKSTISTFEYKCPLTRRDRDDSAQY